MTGLEKITGRILKDADDYVAAAEKETENKVGDIMMDASEEVRKSSVAMAKKAKTDAETLIERAKSSSVLTERNIMLGAKTALIDEAFAEAEKLIRALPAEKYGAFLKGQLDAVLSEAPDKNYTVYPSSGDEQIVGELIKNYGNISLGQSRDIGGGFVIRRGDIEMNCSVGAAVAAVRSSVSGEVCTLLFG